MIGTAFLLLPVVYDYAKILNLKQFTTELLDGLVQLLLSMTMQRY